MGQFSRFQQDHQIRSARERFPHARLAASLSSAAARSSGVSISYAGTYDLTRQSPPAAPPRQPIRKSSCTPCSGTDSRQSPSRICASSGSGCRASKFTAAKIIPGVQIPHCAPPCAMNACCTACNDSPDRDSLDRANLRALPPATPERGSCSPARRPFQREQAPHSPSPHPSFVPVVPIPRAAHPAAAPSDKLRATTPIHSPRTTREFSARAQACTASSISSSVSGVTGMRAHVHARCVRDRVRNRRSGAVQWQLADAFRACRPAPVRNFLEANANRQEDPSKSA